MAGRFNKLFVNKLYMPDGKLKGQNDKMTRVTISATEANYLDGANILNNTANTAALLTTGGALQLTGDLATLKNVGTSAATSVQEGGYGARHTTKMTFTDWDIGAIAGAANEAIGKLIYTFPSTGTIIIHHSGIIGDLDGAAGIAADTPEVGLGTVVATGAVAVLGGTATFENISVGTAIADCNETDFAHHNTPTAGADLVITKGATNKVFLNVADGWAAASATLLFTGTIWLDWSIRTY